MFGCSAKERRSVYVEHIAHFKYYAKLDVVAEIKFTSFLSQF